MLGREQELFQSVKSIEYVCYRASEATDDELKRLLRELPGAGVMLIELDAQECGAVGEQTGTTGSRLAPKPRCCWQDRRRHWHWQRAQRWQRWDLDL